MHPPELAEVAVVTTAVASAQAAGQLAQAAVQQRLAACVQVLEMRSHYRWQEALHEEAEWRLECKTAPDRVPALLALLRARHPYELPELLVLSVQAEAAYAHWVLQETR